MDKGDALLTFMFIVIIISLILAFGVLIGTSMNGDSVSKLTERTQDQFFEIEDLKGQLEVCKYNAGIKEEIVLSTYVMKG